LRSHDARKEFSLLSQVDLATLYEMLVNNELWFRKICTTFNKTSNNSPFSIILHSKMQYLMQIGVKVIRISCASLRKFLTNVPKCWDCAILLNMLSYLIKRYKRYKKRE